MIFSIYFLPLLLALFLFSTSIMNTNHESVMVELSSAPKDQFGIPYFNGNVNHYLYVDNELKTETETENIDDVDLDIKKQNQQLNRDLKTLNYIFLLETQPNMIKDSERLEEIKILKKNLQRQIVKTTRRLNSCKLG